MPDVGSNSLTPMTGDMPAEDFRKYGHQLVDWIADFFENIDDHPVSPTVNPGFLKNQLPKSPPVDGEKMDTILADVDRLIMPGMTHWNHPSFHAYFNSTASGPGILGELLATAFNSNCMLWQSCPSGTELEEVTVGWLRELLGLPEEYWGIIYGGASIGNMHAIAAARGLTDIDIREAGLGGRAGQPRLRLYASRHVHSSIDKSALALGLGLAGVRKIPTDDAFRIRTDLLEQAIAEDRKDGWLPFCVVGVVGTTSTTSIDPIPRLAEICKNEGLWLHVDAAHGGAAAIVPEMRHVFDGCDQADSLVMNAHKWLFVPMELSTLYTRKPEALKNAVSLIPEYLRTAHDDVVRNYMDYNVGLGRRFQALKLWFVLRYFGSEGLISRVREHIRLGQLFAEWVDNHPDFERMAPTPLSTVCFCAKVHGTNDVEVLNDLNRRLMEAVNGTGKAFLTHTKLFNRIVLRFVVSHMRTTEDHIARAWKVIQEQLKQLVEA